MTRIFTDGAEFGDVLFFSSTVGDISANTGQIRTGNYSYRVDNNGSGLKGITDISEFYMRIAVQCSNVLIGGYFLRWFNSSTELGSLRRNDATQLLEAYIGTSTLVGTSTIPILIDTWYLIELHVKIADASGDLEVKIDGILDIDFSGDTKPGSDTTVNIINLYQNNGTNGRYWYYDDLALNDVNGSDDNSWIGDGKVILLPPYGNGDVSGLTGQDADSVDNYLNVDEFPNDSDTTYNEGTVSGTYDLYGITGTTISDVFVLRLFPEGRARDTVADGGIGALGIKVSGSSEYWATGTQLLTSYTRFTGAEYLLNPSTTGTWEVSDVNLLQIGFKVGI